MRNGDEKAGYDLTVDSNDRILRLEVWGLWDDALGARYVADMRACYAKLGTAPWTVLADIRRFPPQSPSVAATHGQLMGEATKLGMRRACSVVASTLTQMQIKRIAEESRMPELSFFRDEPTARSWLLSS